MTVCAWATPMPASAKKAEANQTRRLLAAIAEPPAPVKAIKTPRPLSSFSLPTRERCRKYEPRALLPILPPQANVQHLGNWLFFRGVASGSRCAEAKRGFEVKKVVPGHENHQKAHNREANAKPVF